jgi:hypothetical protein
MSPAALVPWFIAIDAVIVMGVWGMGRCPWPVTLVAMLLLCAAWDYADDHELKRWNQRRSSAKSDE